MRISINTLAITPKCGGIRTYLVELIRALVRVAPDDRFLLIVGDVNRSLYEQFADPGHVELADAGLAHDWKWLRVWREQRTIPRVLESWGSEAHLCPNGVASLRTSCPQVVVMQHPIYQLFVDELPFVRRRYLLWAFPRSFAVARRVVCVSRTSLGLLVERGWVDPAKVDVIPYGVSRQALFERACPQAILDRIGSGYYLFVGDLYPYKGVQRILTAMDLLKRNFGLDRDLVVVGRDLWGQRPTLEMRVRELGLERRVHFLGGVDHHCLGWIYERAFCFVLPSEVEANPLTISEAMVCGAPVVSSNCTAVAETTGDAGIVVDIAHPGEMVWALRRLEEPSVRADYVRRGLDRAARLNWDTAALATLAACRQAAGIEPIPSATVLERAHSVGVES